MKDTFVGQETDAKVQQEGLEMGVIRAKGKNVSGGQFMEDIISKRKCLHFHNIILQICLFTLKKKNTSHYLIFSYNRPKSEHLSRSVVSVCSPPGSSVHGFLQARITGVGSLPFSRGSSQSRDRVWIS